MRWRLTRCHMNAAIRLTFETLSRNHRRLRVVRQGYGARGEGDLRLVRIARTIAAATHLHVASKRNQARLYLRLRRSQIVIASPRRVDPRIEISLQSDSSDAIARVRLLRHGTRSRRRCRTRSGSRRGSRRGRRPWGSSRTSARRAGCRSCRCSRNSSCSRSCRRGSWCSRSCHGSCSRGCRCSRGSRRWRRAAGRRYTNEINILFVLIGARVEIEGSGIGNISSRIIRHDGDIIAYLVLLWPAFERGKGSAHGDVRRPCDAAIRAERIEQLRIRVIRGIARVQPHRINPPIGGY